MSRRAQFVQHIQGSYESNVVGQAFDDLAGGLPALPVQWGQARDVDWSEVLHGGSFASAHPIFYGEST